ncbi:MAG TPA: hypothetical protein VFJ74_11410 [Gemmatimonadaceae bacterium]|nr:hypothetical protein [Gemmatimonadaceae bacterium]
MTSSPIDRPSTARSGLALAALLAGSTVLGACHDTTALKATLQNNADTLTVYALSDTASSRRDFPTAIATGVRATNAAGAIVAAPTPVSVSSSAQFDVAFDIDAAGKVVLYPQRRIVSGVSGRRVGLVAVPGTFETVTEAPKNGYQFDSVAVTVDTGQVVAVQAQTTQCALEVSAYNYSKIVVDSVVPAIQAIYVRIATDPNCGFRSFLPGVPSK